MMNARLNWHWMCRWLRRIPGSISSRGIYSRGFICACTCSRSKATGLRLRRWRLAVIKSRLTLLSLSVLNGRSLVVYLGIHVAHRCWYSHHWSELHPTSWLNDDGLTKVTAIMRCRFCLCMTYSSLLTGAPMMKTTRQCTSIVGAAMVRHSQSTMNLKNEKKRSRR